MPGQYRWSADMVAAEIEDIARAGVPAVLLLGIPEMKDASAASETCGRQGRGSAGGASDQARRPEMVVTTTFACAIHTSHGHCGVSRTRQVANDRTLELLAKDRAISHARRAPTSWRPAT